MILQNTFPTVIFNKLWDKELNDAIQSSVLEQVVAERLPFFATTIIIINLWPCLAGGARFWYTRRRAMLDNRDCFAFQVEFLSMAYGIIQLHRTATLSFSLWCSSEIYPLDRKSSPVYLNARFALLPLFDTPPTCLGIWICIGVFLRNFWSQHLLKGRFHQNTPDTVHRHAKDEYCQAFCKATSITNISGEFKNI